MPRGRPSANAVDRFDDGRFSVVITYRPARLSYRIVSGFRGGSPTESTATDEGSARAVAEAIWASYQRGTIVAQEAAPLTLGELTEAVAERPDLRGSTQRSYRQVWGLFARHVGASRAPRVVYRTDVLDFLESVREGVYSPRGEEASANTIVTYHRTLRAGWRWAIERGWVAVDPTAGISPQADHAIGPWLPYSEWEVFKSHCQPAHEIRAGYVLETGLRAGEIAFARRTWLRGADGRRGIYVGPDPDTGWRPKGKARIVPMTDVAEEYLERAATMWPDSPWLFSHDGLSSLANLARETRRAWQEGGCTPTTFHGLRRSAGAHWIECGMPIYDVSRLLGHADLATTVRWYADVADSGLVRAVAGVQEARVRVAEDEADAGLGAKIYDLPVRGRVAGASR